MGIFRDKLGILGIVLGALGILISAVCVFEGPFHKRAPPVEIQQSIVAKAKNFVAGFKDQSPTPAPIEKAFNIDLALAISVYILGVLAIVMGLLSFIKKEHYRASSAALGIGFVALIFKYAIPYAVLAIVVLVVLWIILNYFEV